MTSDCFSTPICDLTHNELLSTDLQAQLTQVIMNEGLVFNNLFIWSNNLNNAVKYIALKFSDMLMRSMSVRLEDEIRFRNDRMKKKHD